MALGDAPPPAPPLPPCVGIGDVTVGFCTGATARVPNQFHCVKPKNRRISTSTARIAAATPAPAPAPIVSPVSTTSEPAGVQYRRTLYPPAPRSTASTRTTSKMNSRVPKPTNLLSRHERRLTRLLPRRPLTAVTPSGTPCTERRGYAASLRRRRRRRRPATARATAAGRAIPWKSERGGRRCLGGGRSSFSSSSSACFSLIASTGRFDRRDSPPGLANKPRRAGSPIRNRL